VPLRISFDRREGTDFTSRVIFPSFKVSKSLPAFATTSVELMPEEAGEFDFSCQMNMVHGKLIVTDDGDQPKEETPVPPSARVGPYIQGTSHGSPLKIVSPDILQRQAAIWGRDCSLPRTAPFAATWSR